MDEKSYLENARQKIEAEDHEAALDILNKGLGSFPKSPLLLQYHGYVLNQLGDGEGAKTSYERAIECYDPKDRDDDWQNAVLQLGIVLAEHFEAYEEALDLYQQILEINPDHTDAIYNSGSACQMIGRQSEAREFYNQLLEMNPDDAQTSYNIGVTYVEEERYSEALDCFQSLADADPEDEDVQSAVKLCRKKLKHKQ